MFLEHLENDRQEGLREKYLVQRRCTILWMDLHYREGVSLICLLSTKNSRAWTSYLKVLVDCIINCFDRHPCIISPLISWSLPVELQVTNSSVFFYSLVHLILFIFQLLSSGL